VVCLAAALAYTGGPFPLAYHGLGEVMVLVFFGWAAVLGTYAVMAGWPAPSAAWLVATACGLRAANILLVNNIRDIATDARVGKRTLAVRLGRRFAQGLYAVGGLFAAFTPVALVLFGYSWPVLLALLMLPFGERLTRQLAALSAGDGAGFNRLLADTAQLLAWWAALLSLGMVLSR
jgi:1,4-dihydroxy-2-naphthoate octaprenyltransferase